jgi:hypothetical protein
MTIPNLPIEQVFKILRIAVSNETDGGRVRFSTDTRRKLANYIGLFNKLMLKQQKKHIWKIELESDRLVDQVKEREAKERCRKIRQEKSKEEDAAKGITNTN